MEIKIDSHVHVMPPRRLGGLVRWLLKVYPHHPVTEDVTAEEILSDLKKMGVSHFFNFNYPLKVGETDSLNAFNLNFCQNTPGAIPFASMHQDTSNKAQLAEQLLGNQDFAGFKFHPFVQGFDPWDQRMDPLYASLQEMVKPVFFHTGFDDFYGLKMPIERLVGLVKRFPELPMVFVHMAFPEHGTAFELMDDYPQLYLDATNVFAMLRPEYAGMIEAHPKGYKLVDELIAGLEKHSDRIMFGSDHPVGMGGLPEIHQEFETFAVSEQVKQNLRQTTPVAFINRFLPQFDWDRNLLQP